MCRRSKLDLIAQTCTATSEHKLALAYNSQHTLLWARFNSVCNPRAINILCEIKIEDDGIELKTLRQNHQNCTPTHYFNAPSLRWFLKVCRVYLLLFVDSYCFKSESSVVSPSQFVFNVDVSRRDSQGGRFEYLNYTQRHLSIGTSRYDKSRIFRNHILHKL